MPRVPEIGRNINMTWRVPEIGRNISPSSVDYSLTERFSSIYSDLSLMTNSINWPITVRSTVPFWKLYLPSASLPIAVVGPWWPFWPCVPVRFAVIAGRLGSIFCPGHCKTYMDTGAHQIGLVIGFMVSDRVYGLGLGL